MKRSIFSVGIAALVAIAATFAFVSPASGAVVPRYAYNATVGATQVQAVGLTVQSQPTAQSQIVGRNSATRENKIASAKVGSVLVAGVANTDATATTNPDTGGLKLRAHARTTGVSLFSGLIKATAIETTATIDADDAEGEPATEMTTELVGLTIQGKPYQGSIDPNTGIEIPGIVSIILNQQDSAATEDSAAIIGAGLKVTLLGPRNGTAAGASVAINPVSEAIQPGNNDREPGFALNGGAYGSYVHANVGDEVDVESGRTALINMPTMGTGGVSHGNATAKATLNGVLNLGAIYTEQRGIRSDALSQVEESATIGTVSLFNGLIAAKAIGTKSTASVQEDTTSGEVDNEMTFVSLTIAGRKIPIDVAPNTKIHVAKLGTVTINEQLTAIQETGNVKFHGARTIGLHIVLDTKRAGLPVGAEVEIATTQALVWQ
jgi:hypothetical protein